MADIELVIKIPEKTYKHIMTMQFCFPGLGNDGKSLLVEILKAIRTGTPRICSVDLAESEEEYDIRRSN